MAVTLRADHLKLAVRLPGGVVSPRPARGQPWRAFAATTLPVSPFWMAIRCPRWTSDTYCRGAPALDSGDCIAHLTQQALRTAGDATAWAHLDRAAADRLVEMTGGGATRAAVRADAALARHVYIGTLFPDCRTGMRQVLELSRRGGRSGGRAGVSRRRPAASRQRCRDGSDRGVTPA